ncbi:MAG: hypothetical protein IRY99_06610, partial [Isosphaeraceae bacterium]|nr:hypothetical protein [Isosphaeraceae bacterium]
SNLSIYVADPVMPFGLGDPLAVPTQLANPALDPATASNTGNFSLINLGPDGVFGTADDRDFSSSIVSATYVDQSNRRLTNDPLLGRIDLTFAPNLPAGRYLIVARHPQPGFQGITDAAGNPLNLPGGPDSGIDFSLFLDSQPEPAFITTFEAHTFNPVNPSLPTTITGPRGFYELPAPGATPRAIAPPSAFFIDFSNPLDAARLLAGNPQDPTLVKPGIFQLVASADTPGGPSDGDFGDLGQAGGTGSGYSIVPGTSVHLVNQNRLVLTLAPGATLAPDYYRLYLPNAIVQGGPFAGQDLRIFDAFGNQADLEFLANPTPQGGFEDLLPNGQYRAGLTGDGVGGGAFVTSFVVVANGNVLYARPDAPDDPFDPSKTPDGSMEHPYAALAPEAVPNALNGGDLNSVVNFGTGFNPAFDRNGNGQFNRSAFFAAQQLQKQPGHAGPVVIAALPRLDPNDPLARTFVLQAPPGADPVVNNASASVPANTTLVFMPGSILKMQNATLFVQNQGSALMAVGGPNPGQQVVFTSYSDDSAGGDTNRDGSNSAPRPGDWGGLVFRNFDDQSLGRNIQFPVDGKLGKSGADDALSLLNNVQIRYGGGLVPQAAGVPYSPITLYNSRPTITNAFIGNPTGTPTSGTVSTLAAISADMDSFREDDTARGPLVRRVQLVNNSLNGILIRPEETTGVTLPTNAVLYPNNPTTAGGSQNYTFDDPYPYLLISRMEIGTQLLQGTGGQTTRITDRVYIQPGMVFKMQRGAAIDVTNPGASINIGDRTYINEFDANPTIAPTDPGFRPPTTGDANVLFTSIFDDTASTAFINNNVIDPTTGQPQRTVIVAPIDSDNGGPVNQPTPGNVPALARWGSLDIISGALAVIDEATFQYGGGSVNTGSGTIPQRDVLNFEGAGGTKQIQPDNTWVTVGALGTRAYITNNNFFDNGSGDSKAPEAVIGITPDGLLAADPLRPLLSGNPFFRGNVMLRNDLNGMEVLPAFQGAVAPAPPNLHVDSIWDDTDLTYILRGTIRLDGASGFFNDPFPTPPATLGNELKPFLTLTIQSSLPDTLLADGSRIARPGESVLVKLLNSMAPAGDGAVGFGGANVNNNSFGGAGFLVGIDNGVDPTSDSLVDTGAFSQIRILGIGANETTGQPRVPAILTSLRDDSVGKTVRGVKMNQVISGNTTAPAPGDGGVIGFGALSLTDYNLYDPRDGNLIDNADIRYMTRIEMQGGGLVYRSGSAFQDMMGTTPATQFNSSRAMTISNSNLDSFSQVGVIAHNGFNGIDITGGAAARNTQPIPTLATPPNSSGGDSQPIALFMYNNTITHMPVGVRINGENTSGSGSSEPAQFVALNNTFDANPVGIHLEGGSNTSWGIMALVMDNIFSNYTTAGIETQFNNNNFNGGFSNLINQNGSAQAQYNLFSGTGAAVTPANSPFANNQPIVGNPAFRNPGAGQYQLLGNSAAIDAARSELVPSVFGNMLLPISNQALDATGGVRNTIGRIIRFPGPNFQQFPTPGDLVTLPGLDPAQRGFFDQWTAMIGGLPGPASNAGGTLTYVPMLGERDQDGFLRQDDPNVPNIGFGSRPFFDIGSHEFRQLFPPHVIGVASVVTSPTAPGGAQVVDLYGVGTTKGVNQSPQSILVLFDQLIDPTSINNMSVVLNTAGPDHLLGTSDDGKIDLSGRLTFDPVSKILTIKLGAANTFLTTDLYRLTLVGTGSSFLRNPRGDALDGENIGPNGQQLPLPSGDGFPGGNFQVTFSVDTHAPQVVAGTFRLDPGSDTNIVGDNITANSLPTFIGQITDIFPDVLPPSTSPVNETVILQVFDPTTGAWVNRGIAPVGANGTFSVTVTGPPLPDSPYNVGPDGILGTADDTGKSLARVLVVDQSGNVSNPSDPSAQTSFIVDTKGPQVIAAIPSPNEQVTPVNGVVSVGLGISENLDPAKIIGALSARGAGPDGIFGTGDDIPLAISFDPATGIQYLDTPSGGPGREIIHFNINGVTTNGLYQVRLSGTSPNAATDIAGNSLDGEFSGVFPSGNGVPGGDFNLTFVVYSPTLARRIFVGPSTSFSPDGSRANPFPTIMQGLAAANVGDTVAVLPGVYTESVTLKSLVRLVSVDPASTDAQLLPGNALATIIRAPASVTGAPTTTISGANLISIPGFATEVSGFTIASPLVGDPARGPINAMSSGVFLVNSDALIDKNYIIDSGMGLIVAMTGAAAATPRIEDNGLIGNLIGLVINDAGTSSLAGGLPIEIANNTIADNTTGVALIAAAGTVPVLADIVNNIFWQNAELSPARTGTGILAVAPGRLTVRNNLFSRNGPSVTDPSDDAVGVGGSFNPAALGASPDPNGNLTGDPAFAFPIDPR